MPISAAAGSAGDAGSSQNTRPGGAWIHSASSTGFASASRLLAIRRGHGLLCLGHSVGHRLFARDIAADAVGEPPAPDDVVKESIRENHPSYKDRIRQQPTAKHDQAGDDQNRSHAG